MPITTFDQKVNRRGPGYFGFDAFPTTHGLLSRGAITNVAAVRTTVLYSTVQYDVLCMYYCIYIVLSLLFTHTAVVTAEIMVLYCISLLYIKSLSDENF